MWTVHAPGFQHSFGALMLLLTSFTLALVLSAEAQTESLLYTFADASEGGNPPAGVIFGPDGNLYGVGREGGDLNCPLTLGDGCGVVFQLMRNADGSWSENVIYAFTGGTDGALPTSPLVSDKAGNLYGTTYVGGTHFNCSGYACGTIFELSPASSGTWNFTVLHDFDGADGAFNIGGLILDGAGNLYGATFEGGTGNCHLYLHCGTVFRLSPTSSGQWTETVLHDFAGGPDGGQAEGTLVLDSSGNLYGTTLFGGLRPLQLFQLRNCLRTIAKLRWLMDTHGDPQLHRNR